MFKKDARKGQSISFTYFPLFAGTLLATLLTGCACKDMRKPEARRAVSHNHDNDIALVGAPEAKKTVTKAVAHVKSLKDENGVRGKVTFTRTPEGMRVVANFNGLTPGVHGFHIHEHGDCSGTEAAAAGAHFNPTQSEHGGPDSAERHVGDLGNLIADEKGYAHYESINTALTLEGKNSILGRSVIIHADKDDFVTQPAGASGAKIACGVIEVVP